MLQLLVGHMTNAEVAGAAAVLLDGCVLLVDLRCGAEKGLYMLLVLLQWVHDSAVAVEQPTSVLYLVMSRALFGCYPNVVLCLCSLQAMRPLLAWTSCATPRATCAQQRSGAPCRG
jgi:hypothetical protein